MGREHGGLALEGRVALITGAAGGIGAAIARCFSENGARVLVHDVQERGRAVAAELDATFLRADLASMDQVRRLAQQAVAVHGRVDILVNNAGLQHVAPVEEFPEDLWAKILQIMLVATFQLIRGLLPAMKSRGWGRIINLASIHGLVASPFKSAYVSAKHGLLGLTKTVALEAGSSGVTVNAICPAYVRTAMVEDQIRGQAAALGLSQDEVVDRVMLEPAAIKRLIEPEEVARLALFLGSESARSITGAAYTMDLGWTAR